MASPFKAIQTAMVEWGVAWKDVIADAVRGEAPVGGAKQLDLLGGSGDSQTLKTSLRGRATGRAGQVTIEILAGVSYALIVRDGRGVVVPVNAQVLHWVDDAGEDVFRMTAAAIDPNPYPTRGYEKVRAAVEADLGQRLAKAALSELLATAKAGGMKIGL
jgi:hypothetical protein